MQILVCKVLVRIACYVQAHEKTNHLIFKPVEFDGFRSQAGYYGDIYTHIIL